MKIGLSQRLQALADMVSPGSSVADIGCDHGFLSVYLVQNGISPRVLAMDVREGPLARAKEHVALCGLENYIETRLSDGLMQYEPGECRTMVCAGMGGRLMARILLQSAEKAQSFSELILQPQSEIPDFRRFLRGEGYEILDENILWEEGKYYFLIKAAWAGKNCGRQNPLYEEFGEKLLLGRHPVLKQYLQYRQEKALQIEKKLLSNRNSRAQKRLKEVRQEIDLLKRAMDFFESAVREI